MTLFEHLNKSTADLSRWWPTAAEAVIYDPDVLHLQMQHRLGKGGLSSAVGSEMPFGSINLNIAGLYPPASPNLQCAASPGWASG